MTPKLYTLEFMALCAASLLFFCSYHLLTPVFPLHLEAQHVSGMQMGSLVAAFMVASLLVRPWVGKLSDEISRKHLMLAGVVLFGLCPLLYLQVSEQWMLYAVRILHGIGFALFYTASGSYLVNILPAERKGEGISIYSNAIKIAMAIAPGFALLLVQEKHMPLVFQLSAVAALATLVTILCLKPAPTVGPAKTGKLFNVSAAFPGAVMSVNSMAFGALIPFFPLLAAEKGLDNASWFYTLYAVSLIASRFVTGKLSDRYGRYAVTIPGMALVILSLILMGTSSEPWIFPVFAALYGLAAGTVQPSLMAMAADRADKTEQGSAMATFTLLNDCGIAAGTFLMGGLGSQMGYGFSLILVACCTTAGLAFLCRDALMPQLQTKQQEGQS